MPDFFAIEAEKWAYSGPKQPFLKRRERNNPAKSGVSAKRQQALAVRKYVAYALSYCDIERLINKRGVKVDHDTAQRSVVEYSPELMTHRKVITSSAESWRAEETYIKVKDQWAYLYRAVDKHEQTINFMLSEKRDKPAAIQFFAKAIGHAGITAKITIDKSGANVASLGKGKVKNICC